MTFPTKCPHRRQECIRSRAFFFEDLGNTGLCISDVERDTPYSIFCDALKQRTGFGSKLFAHCSSYAAPHPTRHPCPAQPPALEGV